MPQCFQIPATETPGFFAVRRGAERLTHAGRDARTDALRDRLNAAGVEKGALAGILLDRSLSAITSFLAVLKAGGARVPLDPSGPAQGILDIIQRHKLTCVISNAATLRRFPQLAAAVPVIDVDAAPVAGAAGRRGEAVKVAGSDSACVMFTSGASGEPKGVVIPHRVIVTTLFLASCLFNLMFDQRPSPPRKLLYLVSSGNVMPPARAGDGGELFAVGDGVAFGFLDRSDLMAEEFIMDHFGADPRRRMCRTGDLVSQRADGLVEIAGDPDSRTGANGEPAEVFLNPRRFS